MKLEIVVGFYCNNNCKFCSIPFRLGFKLKEQIFKEIVKFANNKLEEINFTGGEPTLRKDLPELIEFAREYTKNVRITTNGRLLSYDWYTKKLVEAGLTGAIFSIHGAKKETHDFLTSVPGAFKQCIQGLKNLAEYRDMFISVNTVITKYNYKELKEICELVLKIADNQYKTHCFIYPNIEGNLKNNLYLVARYSEVLPHIYEAIEFCKEHGIYAWALNIPPCVPDRLHTYFTCTFNTKIVLDEENVADLDKNKYKGKIKSKKCINCLLKDICPGIPFDYFSLYGDNEIRPITDKEIYEKIIKKIY